MLTNRDAEVAIDRLEDDIDGFFGSGGWHSDRPLPERDGARRMASG